jgi:hypothetical protein
VSLLIGRDSPRFPPRQPCCDHETEARRLAAELRQVRAALDACEAARLDDDRRRWLADRPGGYVQPGEWTNQPDSTDG